MNSDIIMKTGKGLDTYLTKEQIKIQAPLVFAEKPTNPLLSNQYLFVNTETIIDDLAKLNWFPVKAAQRSPRKTEGTVYSKHMVSFQNPDILIKGEKGDDAYPRILLTNSHDGTQAFKFMLGIYRLVCSNGLVVADEKFNDFSIRHKGYSFDELRNVVSQAVQDLPSKVEVLNSMKNRILSEEEKHQLATDSMLIRAGIKIGSEQASGIEYNIITLKSLLSPNREEDRGNDLWKVFNTLQEKIIQGDFHVALTGAKVQKVRKIKSFEKDIKVNRELFKLATNLLYS